MIQIKAEIEKIDALTPKFNELNSYVEELYNEVASFAEHHFQATESNLPLNAFQVETPQASSNQPSDTFQTERAEAISNSPALNTDCLASRNIICQISLPFKINKTHSLQPRVSLPSRLTLEPEIQLQYLKDINGNKNFFIGIHCNLTFNGSSLKNPIHEKSRLISVRAFNTHGINVFYAQ